MIDRDMFAFLTPTQKRHFEILYRYGSNHQKEYVLDAIKDLSREVYTVSAGFLVDHSTYANSFYHIRNIRLRKFVSDREHPDNEQELLEHVLSQIDSHAS